MTWIFVSLSFVQIGKKPVIVLRAFIIIFDNCALFTFSFGFCFNVCFKIWKKNWNISQHKIKNSFLESYLKKKWVKLLFDCVSFLSTLYIKIRMLIWESFGFYTENRKPFLFENFFFVQKSSLQNENTNTWDNQQHED